MLTAHAQRIRRPSSMPPPWKHPAPLPDRLALLDRLVIDELTAIEDMLPGGERSSAPDRSGVHRIELRLPWPRATAVLLSAKLGGRVHRGAYDLAAAAELIHEATALPQDVARDRCMVEALRRVQRSGVPLAMERLLIALSSSAEARWAEADGQGRVLASRERFFQVVEGHTGAIFGWAAFAGALRGGLDRKRAEMLHSYGRHVGVAYHITDRALRPDLTSSETLAVVLRDLRRGHVTYPVLMAVERDPSLAAELEEALDATVALAVPASPRTAARLADAIAASGAHEAAAEMASRHAARAARCLDGLPPSETRDALVTLADAVGTR